MEIAGYLAASIVSSFLGIIGRPRSLFLNHSFDLVLIANNTSMFMMYN